MKELFARLNEFKAALLLACFFVVAGWYGATTLIKASEALDGVIQRTSDYSDLKDRVEENRVQIARNSRIVLSLRYMELDAKRRTVGLTASEYAEFCHIGRQLQYFVACPPASAQRG